MTWSVKLTKKAAKQYEKLPKAVQVALNALILEMRVAGPIRGNWSNYSKLSATEHHCHLKKGKPTYVAVWREQHGEVRIVEITYAGTHEKAPY